MWVLNNICTPGHLHEGLPRFLENPHTLNTNVFLRFELLHILMRALALAGSRCIHKSAPRWSIRGSGQGGCERVFNVVWQYWVFCISSTKPGSDWCRGLVSLVTTRTEHIRALKGGKLKTYIPTSAGKDTHNTEHTDSGKYDIQLSLNN